MENKTIKCAKEGCDHPAYTGNAVVLPSRIGAIIVYLCTECFAGYLQAKMAEQTKQS